MNNVPHFENLMLGYESGLKYYISKFGHSLRYFAFSVTKDKGISEEIVSDSFYKLWSSRSRIKSEQSIKSYLYIVTRNACFDFVAKVENKAYFEPDSLDSLTNLEPDFLTKIIYTELLELIAAELTNLPQQQADVFKLAFLEGLSAHEISTQLGTSLNNVYFAKSNALKTLKKVFKLKKLHYYLAFLQMVNDCV